MYDAETPAQTTRPFATFERLESQVRSYSRSFPAIFDRAEGSWQYDSEGKGYIDFLTGCSVLNYGHNHPAMKQALMDYIDRNGVVHSLDMHSRAKAEFLEALEGKILKPRGMTYRAQFTGPTGANAVEAAMKLARKVTGRTNIISFTNGFHGVTLGALSATGNSHHRGGAHTPLNGVTRMPYCGYFGDDVDTAAQLDQMLSDPSGGVDDPAAIIVEPVQGEGGLNVASAEWMRKIEKIAHKHGALFIVDDIQAGCGRTGTFFSFENMGVKPDIITMAKSLSGMGLPMALVLVKPELDQWSPGEHNGTFRGNNPAFVTSKVALDHYWSDDALTKTTLKKGARISECFANLSDQFPGEVSHRGRGLVQGLVFEQPERAGKVCQLAFDEGLLAETSGPSDQVVKLLPALTITDDELEHGLSILAEATLKVCS